MDIVSARSKSSGPKSLACELPIVILPMVMEAGELICSSLRITPSSSAAVPMKTLKVEPAG